MAKDILIQTHGKSAEILLAAIGTDRFYAINSRPLLVKSPKDDTVWEAFMLDPTELGAMQLLGLLKWMADSDPLTAASLGEMMTVGMPVPAEDCEIVRNKPENFFARDARR